MRGSGTGDLSGNNMCKVRLERRNVVHWKKRKKAYVSRAQRARELGGTDDITR